jgi:negative regulator of genetic competence, sporulation and motility
MADIPTYAGPADSNAVDEDDVHEALEYLIAIEPDPDDDDLDIDTSEDYEAYMAQFQPDIARAIATLRAFAVQRQPQTLIEMQESYYGFTNDYLERAEIAGVVRTALSEAWDRIGPWRK